MSTDKNSGKKKGKKPNDNGMFSSVTNYLAVVITGTVLLATLAVAILSFYYEKDNILQTLIPLWGTWVGTVLAFYFGQKNFESATKAIENLSSQEKMSAVLAKDCMVPLAQLKYLRYDEAKTQTNIAILEHEIFKGFSRFAFLDDKNAVKYIIHRNLLGRYMLSKFSPQSENVDNPEPVTVDEIDEIRKLTLEDFVKDKHDKLKNAFAVVSTRATLLEAKAMMDTKSERLDVFITENGDPNEPVLGLITNSIILNTISG